MPLPFDGAISRFYQQDAPNDIRVSIASAKRKDILDPNFPYSNRMARKSYDQDMKALQIELVKLQSWVAETGQRIAIVFEGRDAAGKGGTIKRASENLNPRMAKVVALSKPTEKERGEWYFQRYIQHLPTAGSMTIFDRSWYNRGVVEKVFGFCTDADREKFFDQVPLFEQMIAQEGITLVKIWLNVGRAEQLRRFLARESDPLKQWKLSSIDVKGLSKWDAYSEAISETLRRSDMEHAPWTIVRSDDKKRARLAVARHILRQFQYSGRRDDVIGLKDDLIVLPAKDWNV